ncbi:MAG: hypothetical protein ABI717_04860 [Actinomycetota bacterium]
MRWKRRHDDGRQGDERIATMLERHVRAKDGAAAIKTLADAPLRQRLAAAR